MGRKALGFMYGMFSIFVCIAILFPLLAAVTPASQHLYAENSTATVKALVIGGGGRGGVSFTPNYGGGGGGGGGGYQENNNLTVTAQAYTVTVGDGGQDSSFSTITANAGGSGSSDKVNNGAAGIGGDGGSGAGGNRGQTGGAGNQGNNGGGGNYYGGGGGGGANTAGGSTLGIVGLAAYNGGDGGDGKASTISGSSVIYAGGGGGGSYVQGENASAGGSGGGGTGGKGGNSSASNGRAGQKNTGGGGGGASYYGEPGSGGSGIVIIRYVTADFGECTGGTITTDGADTIHTFTESGTFTVALRTTSPTVTTGSATNVTSNSATLNGTVNANGLTTTTWFNYGITSGTYTGTTTAQSVSGSSDTSVSSDISGLLPSTTYYYRIAAQNSAGTAYGSEVSFTTTPTPTDTTAPSGSISINNGDSYTNSTTVTVTLSATDTVGVTGYYLSTSSSTPVASASGWNSIPSTTSYSGSASYSLAIGDENKTIYAWFKDAAGNVSSAASDSIILDTTAPIVTITSPTLSDTYTTTSSPLSLSGSASDSSSGVKEVTWSNDKGGSGTASGTTYWSVSSISLTSGENTITVTAKDFGGNTSTDIITVTYTASTAPTVETGSAINVTINSATLSGTVNANGLSTTAWFEYGTVKGSYGNKSSTQTVTGSTDTTVSSTITGLTAETTYYYRIAAQNNSGTSYGEEMSFYKSDGGNAPTVKTEAATDITNTTAKLNGKCNPNGQSTTAWFEYGTLSGAYNYQTSTQGVSGSSYTNVSATITGLTVGTKYYYRIAAQNSAGTSYGKEMSFYKSTDTQPTPTPQTSPTPVSTPTTTEKGVIVGTVADEAAGVGIAGAKITTDKGGYSATTGVDGSYTIAEVSVGDYTLTATAEGYASSSQPATVSANEATVVDFLLTLNSKGIIFGIVQDEDENPLKGVTVVIEGNNFSDNTETNEDGFFTFEEVLSGNSTLTFEKEGYETQTMDTTIGDGEVKDLGIITLEQVETGKIYGYVMNIRGNPLEFVRLRLKGIKTKAIKIASSDADGFFEYTDLRADTYVIFAKKRGYRKTQQKVKLEDGESTEIEFEMKKTSKRIKGLIVDE